MFHLDERFTSDTLDPEVWFPYYLPHWSSRSASAATYSVGGGELCLSIPNDQSLWCPDLHEEPLRVSGVQSGSFSGPLGSTMGPQPFREGLVVREEQPTFCGYTPHFGHIEVRMRAVITERSMFAFWMAGIEDQPERSGEILVAEVFGSGIDGGRAEVGMGIREFRDPRLTDEFAIETLELDTSEDHTYAVQWDHGEVSFSIDGVVARRLDQAPDYPMQLMIGVFDFPARETARDGDVPVPQLFVSHVRGRPLD